RDGRVLYVAVVAAESPDDGGLGYLVGVDSRMLAPVSRVRLKDPASGGDALIHNDSSATPMVGPDGDVYFGVLESSFALNDDRGWLLHFDAGLTQVKTPGAFGWDLTPSVVPASAVPEYHGSSAYLVLTKYNHYAGLGTGDGVNRLAILDPNDTQSTPP